VKNFVGQPVKGCKASPEVPASIYDATLPASAYNPAFKRD